MWASTPTHAVRTASEILSCYKFRGKSPEKPKRFFWSVQGGPEGNRNPSGLVFFLPLFLLEKQKKKWSCSCKFLRRFLTLICASSTIKAVRIRRRFSLKQYTLRGPMWASAPTVKFGSAFEFALGICLVQLPSATSQALRTSSPERGALGRENTLCRAAEGVV